MRCLAAALQVFDDYLRNRAKTNGANVRGTDAGLQSTGQP